MSQTYEPALSAKFAHALNYAYTAHATQRRKGSGIPYISHLLAVASTIIDHGGTEDEAIAGLLHDVPEDCGGRPELDRIRVHFGSTVAAIVEGCTDTFKNPKPDWEARKRAYIEHLKVASRSVCLVAAADKLHNARSILNDHKTVGNELWARFSTGNREKVLWYYEIVAEILKERVPARLAEDLTSTVAQISSHIQRLGKAVT